MSCKAILMTCGVLVATAALADTPPAAGYPTITSADSDGTNLFITGRNFGVASLPKITLGSSTLTVVSYSPTSIVAALSASVEPGSYPLWVESFTSTTFGSVGLWSYLGLTLGAVGPQGPPGPRGKDGTPGAPGQSVTASSEPPGVNCEHGGVRFDASNGTTFACNGAPGQDGANGAPGQSVAGIAEPPGANCAYGGAKYIASNGTTFVCNGAPGAVDFAAADARYVNSTGDTMSGALDMNQQRVLNRGCPFGYVRPGPGLCVESVDAGGQTFSACANRCRDAGAHVGSSAEMRAAMQSGVGFGSSLLLDWIDAQDTPTTALVVNSDTDPDAMVSVAVTQTGFCRCFVNVE